MDNQEDNLVDLTNDSSEILTGQDDTSEIEDSDDQLTRAVEGESETGVDTANFIQSGSFTVLQTMFVEEYQVEQVPEEGGTA